MGRNKKVIELTPQETNYGAKIDDSSKYWYILAWENSIRKDWKKWLEQDGIKWIAMLHNRDLKEDGKTLKAPHYHFFLDAGGTQTRSAMIRYREELNGTSLLKRKYKNRAVDYLSHRNSPKKAQYDISEYLYGNMDEKEFKKYLKIDKEEKNIQFKQILDIIDEYRVKSVKQLLSLLDSGKLGLSKDEKESLYADVRGGDFFRINSILASINKENYDEREMEKKIKERLKEIVEEKKEEQILGKKIVPQEFEKEIVEVEQKYGINIPRDKKITKEMLEEIRKDFGEEDIMAGFRELEEQEKNKK